eukprot:4111655-Karenia_brevis.AAC.1
MYASGAFENGTYGNEIWAANWLSSRFDTINIVSARCMRVHFRLDDERLLIAMSVHAPHGEAPQE